MEKEMGEGSSSSVEGSLFHHPCYLLQRLVTSCLRCFGFLQPSDDHSMDPPHCKQDGSSIEPLAFRRPPRSPPREGRGGQIHGISPLASLQETTGGGSGGG